MNICLMKNDHNLPLVFRSNLSFGLYQVVSHLFINDVSSHLSENLLHRLQAGSLPRELLAERLHNLAITKLFVLSLNFAFLAEDERVLGFRV